MTEASVLGLFSATGREDSLRVISRALLRIRSNGHTCADIGKILDCSADTVENASNEKSLLGFDSIVRLALAFPDEFKLVEALWTGTPAPTPSPAERLERIEREAGALRKEFNR